MPFNPQISPLYISLPPVDSEGAVTKALEERKNRNREYKALQELAEVRYGLPKEVTTPMGLDELRGKLQGMDAKEKFQYQQDMLGLRRQETDIDQQKFQAWREDRTAAREDDKAKSKIAGDIVNILGLGNQLGFGAAARGGGFGGGEDPAADFMGAAMGLDQPQPDPNMPPPEMMQEPTNIPLAMPADMGRFPVASEEMIGLLSGPPGGGWPAATTGTNRVTNLPPRDWGEFTGLANAPEPWPAATTNTPRALNLPPSGAAIQDIPDEVMGFGSGRGGGFGGGDSQAITAQDFVRAYILAAAKNNVPIRPQDLDQYFRMGKAMEKGGPPELITRRDELGNPWVWTGAQWSRDREPVSGPPTPPPNGYDVWTDGQGRQQLVRKPAAPKEQPDPSAYDANKNGILGADVMGQTMGAYPGMRVKAKGTNAPAAAPAKPAPTGQRIRVISPEGKLGSVPADKLDAALKAGFKTVQ